MSKSQLEWLIANLKNTENDWKIVVVSHLCIDEIGRWTSYQTDASAECFVALREIFADYVAHTSGSNSTLGITWDFTKNTTNKLVCNLAGDSHFNNYAKRDGVNYIVRQGYGNISSAEMPSGATFDALDSNTNCNFDILCVKTNGNAKIFRIGVGGSARDIEFTF